MECLVESVWQDLGFLRQDFWAHHVISISNHREPLPHSLHMQELPFYWPKNVIVVEIVYAEPPKGLNSPSLASNCGWIPCPICWLNVSSPIFIKLLVLFTWDPAHLPLDFLAWWLEMSGPRELSPPGNICFARLNSWL